MKQPSNLAKLMEYAGGHRYLTYASWILSAVSAFLALVPFWLIWRILLEVLEVAPDFAQAQHIAAYGWLAVLFAVLSGVHLYRRINVLHLAAFRVATNIRLALTHHIAALPLGRIEAFGSGSLRRIIVQTSSETETYLAHQLPDKAKVVATTIGLLLLLLVFDWRLGILSLLPIVLGFAIMFQMTGPSMQQKMAEYQNALNHMSNEAVEYVRGIPVVKPLDKQSFRLSVLRRLLITILSGPLLIPRKYGRL